jgi:hypothetical protein
MSGLRSDTALFAKLLPIIAEAEATKGVITAVVIHMAAAISISVRLEV